MTDVNNNNKLEPPVTQNNQHVNTVNNKIDIVSNKKYEKQIFPSSLSQTLYNWAGFFLQSLTLLTSFFSFIIALIIFDLLQKLDAIDLYNSSLASFSSLLSIVLVAFIFAFTFCVLVFTPTIIATMLVTTNYNENKIPTSLIMAYFLTPLAFIIYFWSSWEFTKTLSVEEILCIVALILIGVLFIPSNFKPYTTIWLSIYHSLTKKNKIEFLFIIVFIFIATILPIPNFASLNNFFVDSLESKPVRISIIITSILGYIPGCVYLALKSSNHKAASIITKILVIIVILAILSLIVSPLAYKTIILKNSGIYNDQEQHFLLINDSYKKAILTKLLTTDNYDKDEVNDETKIKAKFLESNIFPAYTQYFLGNNRVLCKKPFPPHKLTKNTRLKNCITFKDSDIAIIYVETSNDDQKHNAKEN
ncbi:MULTISPECIES: hypothetical protein [Entomomonas]|uniref:Uncharacterized protein n=1 Tax=Entomomonas asaccharolytica TaxID=2785331 RepID=A0A974NHS4_9GAMM|nr:MULTISPECIES: hypothetical protein [Entomomonas]QQP86845.1 hypothetical protein JHT90_06280 [Entomomonas asaccharolytica]UYZ83537.1 hypothetical protein MTZ49_13175 [Entomomonas sp. E2T0]